MKNRNYNKTITVNTSAKEAMKKISQVNLWWIKGFSGSAEKLNEKFHVSFGDPSYVDFVISELVPGKKVVWKVSDCFLHWFQDKKEWNNTEVVFNLFEENGQTKIDFTHVGLVPEIECYESCVKGWDQYAKNSLLNLLNTGTGQPQKSDVLAN